MSKKPERKVKEVIRIHVQPRGGAPLNMGIKAFKRSQPNLRHADIQEYKKLAWDKVAFQRVPRYAGLPQMSGAPQWR